MKNILYKNLVLFFNVFASKALLLWLIGGWLIYYVSTAIWMDEAFAFFVLGVRINPLVQVPFVLFLISGYLNLARVFKDKLRGGKIGFVAWLMISTGVMLYFTGFLLSINVRQVDNRLFGAGDMVDLQWSNDSYIVSSVKTVSKTGIQQLSLEVYL